MPAIMRPSLKSNDDVLDAERLRQIARRKEQNRNGTTSTPRAQGRIHHAARGSVAELHRRSQSQEEESHS